MVKGLCFQLDDSWGAGQTLKDGQIRRIYSHLPVDDVDTFHALRLSGYEVEGVLKGPYRDGVDMFTVGKIISQ
jgi:hypothetical protein